MFDSVTNSENVALAGPLHPMSRVVIPYTWHQELLERYLERADENMALARVNFSRLPDGSIEWLVREILPDRSTLANPSRGTRYAAFTRSDDSRSTPWMDSNLPALPQTVVAEIFHGTSAFRGTAWGFHRDMQSGRIVPLDELSLPGAGMLRVPLRIKRTAQPELIRMPSASPGL